jgi:hypothetical protein
VPGLYNDPPDKAVVLCVDEKSQAYTLDRSQPVLPMMPGMLDRAWPGLRAETIAKSSSRWPASHLHDPVFDPQRIPDGLAGDLVRDGRRPVTPPSVPQMSPSAGLTA